jgi:desulfoferrodoxin (superoxide reductase-like protein)
MKRFTFLLAGLFCFFLSGAFANKTSVEIKAPAEVNAGTEVTITVNVLHSGNSKSHHTEWVSLIINGKEIQRWNYTKEVLPPDANFTLEYKIIASEDLKIEAEGNCNMHGSKGPQSFTVKVTQ